MSKNGKKERRGSHTGKVNSYRTPAHPQGAHYAYYSELRPENQYQKGRRTMEKTVTAAQVKEQFIVSDVKDAMQKIREAQDKEWDMERAADLIVEIFKTLNRESERNGESIEGWNTFDKLTWAVKEAYIIGFLKSFEIVMQTNQMGYNALFGE